MIDPSRLSRQMSSKSRSIFNTQGGGTYVGGGGQTTSRTSNIISTFEKKGSGEHIGKMAPDLHTVSYIIQQFVGLQVVGKMKIKSIWVI